MCPFKFGSSGKFTIRRADRSRGTSQHLLSSLPVQLCACDSRVRRLCHELWTVRTEEHRLRSPLPRSSLIELRFVSGLERENSICMDYPVTITEHLVITLPPPRNLCTCRFYISPLGVTHRSLFRRRKANRAVLRQQRGANQARGIYHV